MYVYGKNDPALRLKALTPADAERWVNGLTEWVAYCKATMPAGGRPGEGGKSRMSRLL